MSHHPLVPFESPTLPHPRRGRRIGVAATSLALAATALASPQAAAGDPGPKSTLSHFAGTGLRVEAREGPALRSGLNTPGDLVVDDSGNLFVADAMNHRVEKITPEGELSFVAGTGEQGEVSPGSALESDLGVPIGLALDSVGNLYISDGDNHQVLKVTPQGVLSVVAGNGTGGNPVEGLATASPLEVPVGLALDSTDNLFIADISARLVLKVTPLGLLSFFAGDGDDGGVDEGVATNTSLDEPADLVVDSSDNLYVSLLDDDRVVKVTSGGTLSYFLGDGSCGGGVSEGPVMGNRVCGPVGLALAADGGILIAAAEEHRVIEVDDGDVEIIAGDGSDSTSYGIPATEQGLGALIAVAMGSDGIGYFTNVIGRDVISRYSPETQTVPREPVEVAAAPGDEEVEVHWSRPMLDGGPPILGYSVRLTPVNSRGRARTYTAGASDTSLTVEDLSNGRTYTVQVAAKNVIGTGAWARVEEDVVPGRPPDVPYSIVATPADQSIGLTFTAPSTGGHAITRYEVTFNAGTDVATLPTSGSGSLSATLTGLTNGTAYTVQLRAVNDLGAGSWSTGDMATPRTVPGVPTSVGTTAGDAQATITWGVPVSNGGSAITGYTVTATPTVGAPVTVTPGASDLSTTLTGLANGTAYQVTVAATNVAGTGATSSPESVTPVDPAATVIASQLPLTIHVGAPTVQVPLSLTLDLPRSSVAVTLKSASNDHLVASTELTRMTPGADFSGMLTVNTSEIWRWGAHQYSLVPEAPGDTLSVNASVRLHSLLGMRATRSGDWISVTGSARAYHSVLNTYKPWNAHPIAVQRYTGNGWVTITTLTSDPNGNVAARLKIPWTVGLRLWSPDSAAIWGAATSQQVL